jgi:scyllo-inositol 2-dehydrogenase (NADP+)
MSMKRCKNPAAIKVAVIGYGGAFNMGRQHLQQCANNGMTPTAVVELDEARLVIAREDFPDIETYTNVSDMLRASSANLIIIITPHNSHAPLTLQCLKAGRHVVCEKPMALTTAECDAMIREANKRKLMLSAYHNRHWDGCILEALDHIKQGAVGDIVRIEARMGGYGKPGDWWRSLKSISGGIMYDWGVHLLEYCLQIVKSDIVEVSGFAHSGFWAKQVAWKSDANEDEATAVVRFANGVMLTLRMTSLELNGKNGIVEITGTKGAYVFHGKNYELITPRENGAVHTKGGNREGEEWRYYRNITDHLVKGTQLVITPEWARRPIHIIDLAGRSAAQAKTLKAKYA